MAARVAQAEVAARLAEHVTDLLARVERAIGVLEDDLHLAAQLRRQAVPGDVDLVAIDESAISGLKVDDQQFTVLHFDIAMPARNPLVRQDDVCRCGPAQFGTKDTD